MNKRRMTYKGFSARIMEAERLTGSQIHKLPPGIPLAVYYVDEFLNPKENWMKGPGAFVVPVKPDKGLWFDWRDNDELNTAVVPTVKGCNPITGLQTSGFHLEQYEDKCPKHGCDFLSERFCPECDYNWPERNYCSQNPLWWDGYRVGDSVRQFFFTSDQNLDVAPRLIGKENTIPAFGFAFYSPKERREVERDERCRGVSLCCDSPSISEPDYSSSPYITADSMDDFCLYESSTSSLSKDMVDNSYKTKSTSGGPISPPSPVSGSPNVSNNIFHMNKLRSASRSKSVSRSIKREKLVEVSIGAGAKIRQSLNKDPYPLESWKEVPDAVMTIYFIFHNEFEELRAKGMRDLSGKSEGMLEGLPVG